MAIYLFQPRESRETAVKALEFAAKAIEDYVEQAVEKAGREHKEIISRTPLAWRKEIERLRGKLDHAFGHTDHAELDEKELSIIRSSLEIYRLDLSRKAVGVKELTPVLEQVNKKIVLAEWAKGDGTLFMKYYLARLRETGSGVSPALDHLATLEVFGPELKKKIKDKQGMDARLIDKAIGALEVVARLYSWNLNATFKGGTAAQLLLPQGLQRLSTDIDIATNAGEDYVENALDALSLAEGFQYKKWRVNPDKQKRFFARYGITSLYSPTKEAFFLDVVFKDLQYEKQRTQLKTFYYDTKEPVFALTPTLNSMLGDKLTTMGPETIGRPFEKDPLKPAKHLYDINALADYATSTQEIYETYRQTFLYQKEIRSLEGLSFQQALDDLLYAAKIYSLAQTIPKSVADKKMLEDAKQAVQGLNSLAEFVSKQNREMSLRIMAREASGKMALLEKLLEMHLMKEAKAEELNSILKCIPLVKKNQADGKLIEQVKKGFEKIDAKKRLHIHPTEMVKAAPAALIYWYGHYYPFEFKQALTA